MVSLWCSICDLGRLLVASPDVASTTFPGSQKSREVNASSTPGKPTLSSASEGHFLPFLSGSDHFVTRELVQ